MTLFDMGTMTLLGCALVFAVLAVPRAFRRIPRNQWCGFRPRATLRDEMLWYAANAHFARRLLIVSAVIAVMALVLRGLSGLSADTSPRTSPAIVVVPPLMAVVATWRFIRTRPSGERAADRPDRR